MVFSGIPFIYYFLPAVIILYLIAPGRFKNAVLLFSSLVFYGWGEKALVFMLMLAILLGFAFGIAIEKTNSVKIQKTLLAAMVIINLGFLCYYKYVDFFIENINKAFGVEIPLLHIALPIGISFYTFQLLSYGVDVYRRDVQAEKNIIDFAAYVSFFPQLIAGPIVRYKDISVNLKSRIHSLDKISYGIKRFAVGLGKKVLLANAFGNLATIFRESGENDVLFFWLYALGFMLQIYFDFSAYSDMAIGLASLFGFSLLENFNYPYISKSITDFWRRWHISLSSWFRDYVYIPLGGSRDGVVKQIINIFIVWMLTGFWHGASWNFIVWGLFYAILLLIEKLVFKNTIEKIPVINHLYVVAIVMMGFVIFNAETLSGALNDLGGLVGIGTEGWFSISSLYYFKSYLIIFVLGIVGATPLPVNLYRVVCDKMKRYTFGETVICITEVIFVATIVLVSTAYLVAGSYNPFLYFRF